jgi:hypothetical protein
MIQKCNVVLHHPRRLVQKVIGGSVISEGSMRTGDESASADMEVAEEYPSELCEKGVISNKFNLSCG